MKEEEKKKNFSNENPTALPDVEFLTRRESAIFLRLSIATFDKLKDIEFIKYGKSKRFSIEALRNYAKQHTVGGTKNE